MSLKKIILAPLLLTFLFLVPSSIPHTHAQLIGEVCLAPPGTPPSPIPACPNSPPTFTGTVGTQLRVAVFIQGSDTLSGFDITLMADHNILKPADADSTGTVLQGSLTVLAKCIGGVLIQGSVCPSQATGNPDTLQLAITAPSLTPAPVTGLAFTAVYNITGTTTGISLSYQTGCTSVSSVSGTTTCVIISNGTGSPVPETIQGATFSNLATTEDFSLTASPISVAALAGATATSTITVAPVNGFTGTVALTSTVSPASLGCSLSPTSIVLGVSQTSTLSCSGPAGTYTATVTGTSSSLTHTATVTFTVKGFTISGSPTSLTVKRGSSATSTLTITPINGFTGTVNLSTSISPTAKKGPTASLASPSVTITAGSVTDILTVSSPHGGTTGTFTVILTGTSGTLSRSVTITVTVTK